MDIKFFFGVFQSNSKMKKKCIYVFFGHFPVTRNK